MKIMENKGPSRIYTALFAAFLLLGGCVGGYVIPDTVNQDIDRNLSFSELLSNPEAHVGMVVALGGAVLSARNLKEGTEIEVLQLPLDRYDRPSGPVSESQGRFLVIHPGYLETAKLNNGQRITVVGEVTGSEVRPIDEAEYAYPYLKTRFLHVWTNSVRYGEYRYPYDPYYYYPYGPYGPRYYPWYPYDPWGPPVIIAPDENRRPERRLDPSGGSPPPSKGHRRQLD